MSLVAIDTSVVVALTEEADANHDVAVAWFQSLSDPAWMPAPVVVEAIGGSKDPKGLTAWIQSHVRILAFDARAAIIASDLVVAANGIKAAAEATTPGHETRGAAKQRVKLDFMILAASIARGGTLFHLDDRLTKIAHKCGASSHLKPVPRIPVQKKLL